MRDDANLVTITPELHRGMVRSFVWLLLFRRRNLVIWAVGLIALWSSAILDSHDTLVIYVAVAWIGWFPLLGIMLLTNARKSVAAAMPIGSTYALEVGPDGLRSESAAGSGHVNWSLLSELHLRRDLAALRHTGRTVFAITPRAAWSASDLEIASGFVTIRR